MPKESVLQSWAEKVPDDFRFVLKAPQRITHIKRLKDAEGNVDYLFRVAAALGSHPGRCAVPVTAAICARISRAFEKFLIAFARGSGRSGSSSGIRPGSTTRCSPASVSPIARSAWLKWMIRKALI